MRELYESQCILSGLCAELRRLDERLGQLGESLPEPAEGFRAPAELREAIESVRSDLLDDAISTLQSAATRSEVELRRAFERRRELLAQGGLGCKA